jgi:hypothetical protein
MDRTAEPSPTLGTTGVEVSRLCLGSLAVGSSAEWAVGDRSKSRGIIDRIATMNSPQWPRDGDIDKTPQPVRGAPITPMV